MIWDRMRPQVEVDKLLLREVKWRKMYLERAIKRPNHVLFDLVPAREKIIHPNMDHHHHHRRRWKKKCNKIFSFASDKKKVEKKSFPHDFHLILDAKKQRKTNEKAKSKKKTTKKNHQQVLMWTCLSLEAKKKKYENEDLQNLHVKQFIYACHWWCQREAPTAVISDG